MSTTGATEDESLAPARLPASDTRLAEIAAAYGALPGVVAVVLAGSRAADAADAESDIDLYVYAAKPPPLTARAALADRFASERALDQSAWEPGDEWRDAVSGVLVDVIYRTPEWIEAQIDRVLVNHEPALGYSTCFWCNVLMSRPLEDPAGWYTRLREYARRPYPESLRQAIVRANHAVLRNGPASYLAQLERAVARDDGVSIQHRFTALLASYFDIVFAVNRLPHPGEKRLLAFARQRCATLPFAMDADLSALLALAPATGGSRLLDRLTVLLDRLDAWLQAEGISVDGSHAGE